MKNLLSYILNFFKKEKKENIQIGIICCYAFQFREWLNDNCPSVKYLTHAFAKDEHYEFRKIMTPYHLCGVRFDRFFAAYDTKKQTPLVTTADLAAHLKPGRNYELPIQNKTI